MQRPENRSAPAGRNPDRGAEQTKMGGGLRGNSNRLPRNWRDRLPSPAEYYPSHLEALSATDADGWAAATCPLCGGSLNLHLTNPRGFWWCAECGSGDLLAFHQRLREQSFVTAVRELVRRRP